MEAEAVVFCGPTTTRVRTAVSLMRNQRQQPLREYHRQRSKKSQHLLKCCDYELLDKWEFVLQKFF